MDNQELNLWLLKKLQTESSLRTEERKLESVRSEYKAERNKYHNARENFQSTKLRLLNENSGDTPHLKLESSKVQGERIKEDRFKLAALNERISGIESKLKRQSVLVLQSKKKLEVLEERINVLRGKKSARKDLKEELEVLDIKIQQMAINASKFGKDFEKLRDLELKEEDQAVFIDIQPNTEQEAIRSQVDTSATGIDSFNSSLMFNDYSSGPFHNSNQQGHQENNEQVHESRDNQEYYEQIRNLSYLKNDAGDKVSLRYYNKSGQAFELEIRRELNNGFIVEIRPHSKVDAISLNSGKYEIIRSLREQGLILNQVLIKELKHAA